MPRKPFRDTSDFGRKSQGTVDQCLAASNRKVSEVGIGVRGNMVDCMIILTVVDISEYWRCIDDTCIPRLGLRRLVTHRGGVGHRHAELGVLLAGRCYGPLDYDRLRYGVAPTVGERSVRGAPWMAIQALCTGKMPGRLGGGTSRFSTADYTEDWVTSLPLYLLCGGGVLRRQ